MTSVVSGSRGAPGAGLAHAADATARRPRRTGWPAPGRDPARWRTRPRSAMTETVARRHVEPLGRLGAPQLVDEDQAPDLALARGQLGEQRRQQRAEVGEQRVRRGVAGDRDEADRAATCARASTSRATWKAVPVRSVAGPVPGSIAPATIAQRSPRASGWRPARSTARNGSAVAASRPWTSSPWVNPNDASRSGARVRAVEVRAQRAQPGGGTRVATRVDDVAEQHDPGGRSGHPREPTGRPIRPQGLTSYQVAVIGLTMAVSFRRHVRPRRPRAARRPSACAERVLVDRRSRSRAAGGRAATCSASRPSRRT